MYKVKIVTGNNLDYSYKRITKNNDGISLDGRYQFFIDEEIDAPDFLVVRNRRFVRTPLHYKVARENTILALSEPESILHFSPLYTRQFATVVGCQPNIKHPHAVAAPAFLDWLIGAKGERKEYVSYKALKESGFPKKTKLISVITSNKVKTRGHMERIQFVRRLKERYGDRIDVYGRGINDFDDRWDVLAPYKYHIAIENCSEPYYWTEKISECFLCGTFPIYHGCTNIGDYFPQGSFEGIDINNFDATCAILDKILAEDRYEQSVHKLAEAKDLVLDKYNIIEMIAALCDTLNPNAPKEKITIMPEKRILNTTQMLRETFLPPYYKARLALFPKG